MRDGIIIRKAVFPDAGAISILSTQLGYSPSVNDTERYFKSYESRSTDVMYVVEDGDEVVAWMQVSDMIRLESGRFCEIVGLVVDERYRGKGIGKLLVRTAIEWCRNIGCTKLKVRTNVLRKETHVFYELVGFAEVKEQKIFEMEV